MTRRERSHLATMARGEPRHVWLPVRPTFKEALFLVIFVVVMWRVVRSPGPWLESRDSLWPLIAIFAILALVVGSIMVRSFVRVPEVPEEMRAEIEARARRDIESGEVEELEFEVRDAIAVVDPTIDETTYLLDVGGGQVLCLEAHQLPGYGSDDQARAIIPWPRRSISLTRAVPSREVLACRSRGERVRASLRLPFWSDAELEADRAPTDGALYSWDFSATGADGKAPLVEPGDHGS